MRTILALLLLVACGRPVHPFPVDSTEARAAIIQVQCGDQYDADSPWTHTTTGTAVVVSSQLAITAAHVLDCPEIPIIHLTLADGTVMWSGIDHINGLLAYLGPWGALDEYGPWADVEYGEPGYYVCLATPMSDHCGSVHETRFDGSHLREFSFDVPGKPGLSGAGVWSYDRRLVGIVQGVASNGDAVASAF